MWYFYDVASTCSKKWTGTLRRGNFQRPQKGSYLSFHNKMVTIYLHRFKSCTLRTWSSGFVRIWKRLILRNPNSKIIYETHPKLWKVTQTSKTFFFSWDPFGLNMDNLNPSLESNHFFFTWFHFLRLSIWEFVDSHDLRERQESPANREPYPQTRTFSFF